MTTCYLMPDPVQSTFFIPGGNTPGNGAQVGFFAAGSNTPITVYKDNAASVAWSNPIILDSGGNLPSGGEVWLPTGVVAKVTWAPSNDTFPPASPYRTMDNLSGINDVSVTAQSEWAAGPTPTFIGATSFSLSGDQTTTFTNGRRLKTTNTGGTIYSTIVGVIFGAGITTVTLINDSGSLDSGLSAVFYGIFNPSNPSIDAYEINRKAASVASAGNGTTDIWGIAGDYAHITGTNTIYNFSSAPYAGAERSIVIDSVLTISTSGAIAIPGGYAVSTAAGDSIVVRADTVSTAVITQYTQAPSWRLLQSITANNSSNLDFTGLDDTYDTYMFSAADVLPATDGATLFARVGTGSGPPTFDSTVGHYRFGVNVITSAGGTGVDGDNGSSSAFCITRSSNPMGNPIGQGGSFDIKFTNPEVIGGLRKLYWTGTYVLQSNGNSAGVLGTGLTINTSSGAITAMRFFMSPGNVSTGTIRLYGLRK